MRQTLINFLENPYVYTYLRYPLIRDQKDMKVFFKKYVDKYNCKSIADVCAGTGDFAVLTPKDAAYVGLDNNEEYIEFAKKRYKKDKNKSFIKADVLTSKSMNAKKYDAVLLISTMHHFSDEELEKLLPRVKKMMGKVLIIADIIPNPPNPIQKFFTKIDRGKFVRPVKEKLNILEKYFEVEKTKLISSGSVVQFCIVCKKK